jgi:alpha-amylase/alpha-mannosidase (GH57 family)
VSRARPLDLVLLWHMHQPDYRDQRSREFLLPWVYLHAIKDYTDMAWHLEHNPGISAVVNFVPVLVDQLEDYTAQFATGNLRDPLLRLLGRAPGPPLGADERAFALDRCFHANHHRMIGAFPAYRRLHELFLSLEAQGPDSLAYLSDQYLFDLVTWYHLAWTGETVRRESALIGELMEQGQAFSHEQRLRLLDALGALIAGILPRYRRLEETGRVELSTTPALHPLSPLLLDLRAGRESIPDAPLPRAPAYPGGRERVERHLASAIGHHQRVFGSRPRGMWPAEGAVSTEFAGMMAAKGFSWTASSEGVLARSLAAAGPPAASRSQMLYRPYELVAGGNSMSMFFRDDRLSDLIGFEYAKWHGQDAAAHFLGELDAISAAAVEGDRPVVSVILDGENAWEYYPFNAFYFFEAFYAGLGRHPGVRTHTYSGYLEARASGALDRDGFAPSSPGKLRALVAGSWVGGTLATWIGSAEKNRAWDLLAAAKGVYDEVMATGRLDDHRRALAERQLAVCEGSDWFWWFGDYNPSESVASFDRLYRTNLANLYELLGRNAPPELATPISFGGGHAEVGGAMRRAS